MPETIALSTVLIIDDDPRMCESLEFLLKSSKLKPFSVETGIKAKSILKDSKFDLIILDVHLPDLSGHDILRYLNALGDDTPVIVISGDADLESAMFALRLGAYDFIRKPFEVDELLKTVENAIYRKALEQKKRIVEEQLRLSEEKYRYLVQNCPDIIFTIDEDYTFTFVSNTVVGLLGIKVDDLIGKHFKSVVDAGHQDNAINFFNELRAGNRYRSYIELQLKIYEKIPSRPHQNMAPTAELSATVINTSTVGRGTVHFAGFIGIIHDIIEKKRLQHQLQYIQKMESLGTLAGGVAHDFNNLLMGIQGRCSLMSMDLDDSHPHMEHLNSIAEIVQSGTTLTAQLLGLARGGKYEIKATDINKLVLKTAEFGARTNKEIKIETHCQRSNLVVECDQNQIEQVMINLLVNACQAMPDGGKIHIQTKKVDLDSGFCKPHQVKPGEYVMISVADKGIGIPPDVLERIFDPFFTTKEKSKGTGLGLASAYGIIKNHSGIICVRSEFGHGTIFDVYLPASGKQTLQLLPSSTAIAKGTEKILLVDDEITVVEIIQTMLKRLGYQVIFTTNGEDAVNTVMQKGETIDLVILDMKMPGMDGGETFDHLHALQPDLPVLLCSGYSLNSRVQHILKRGGRGFIQKPFKIYELSQKIRCILDHSRKTSPVGNAHSSKRSSCGQHGSVA